MLSRPPISDTLRQCFSAWPWPGRVLLWAWFWACYHAHALRWALPLGRPVGHDPGRELRGEQRFIGDATLATHRHGGGLSGTEVLRGIMTGVERSGIDLSRCRTEAEVADLVAGDLIEGRLSREVYAPNEARPGEGGAA